MLSAHSKDFAAGHPRMPATARQTTARPILSYLTNRNALSGEKTPSALLDKIRAAAAAGVDWVQVREKDLSARELLALVREAVALGSDRPGSMQMIVNDRLDVALAAGSAGVHLGHASVPARD